MTPLAADPPAADTLAFVDESGARGYSRKLTPARDHELGLVCALLVPAPRVEEFRDAFRPGYQRFLDAMPEGAKLHITDAFASGNERWATVARSVRSEFHKLIGDLEIPVIYEARRLAVDRKSHELTEALISRAKATSRSPVAVSDRPSQSTVEESLLVGLSLKLDAFCEDAERQQIDLLFDALDGKVAQLYRAHIERTRNIGKSTCTVKGWNRETKSRVEAQLSCEAHASFTLNTRFLGELVVAGKADPLVLAADIVANSLYNHLKRLSPAAPLNNPASIDGWNLEERVYGTMDNAISDNL